MIYLKNILKTIGLVVLVLILNIVPMLLIRFEGQKILSSSAALGVGIGYLFVVVGIIILLWKRYKSYEAPEISQQKLGWKDVGITLLYWLAFRAVAFIMTLINTWYSGSSTTQNDQAIYSLTELFSKASPLSVLLFIFVVALGAPIIEELAFRAFPTVYFKSLNRVVLCLLTAGVFSLLHMSNIIEFFLYGIMGVILYLSYQRRGNIKDSILLHVLNNLPGAIVLLIPAIQAFFK